MAKTYKNLTSRQQKSIKAQQHNINKAINHFLGHKQYPIIVNKILDNYGKKKSLTFGLFKKITAYAFKHPKHAYFLMKLLRSSTIADKLEAYLQGNYNHIVLNEQILNLINNQTLINLFCEKYATTLHAYNLSKEDIDYFIKQTTSAETKDILPVLLNNTKKLLEINKYFNNNQLVEATKATLGLLEKEPKIKKYTKFLVLKAKNWLSKTSSNNIINNNPIIKDLSQLPNEPLMNFIGVLFNTINNDLFKKSIEIYNKQDYYGLMLFILQAIKGEHYKSSSELIGFLSSKENKMFLNQVIAILSKYQPGLQNIINLEDIVKLITNKAGIDKLISLIKGAKQSTKLNVAKDIVKIAVTTPIIPSIITKGTIGWMMGKLSNWWKPNNTTTNKTNKPK